MRRAISSAYHKGQTGKMHRGISGAGLAWHLSCSITQGIGWLAGFSATLRHGEGYGLSVERGGSMPDWTCRLCNNRVRERPRPPAYCPRCGVGNFAVAGERTRSESSGSSAPVLSPALQLGRFTVIPTVAPKAPQERRRARRVQPKTRLHVRICQIALLEAVDVSSVGLLVEHTFPLKLREHCEVELRRSGQTVRLRGEVVRSFVIRSEGSSGTLRYRTALRFPETPREIFGLLPELVEDS